ncbi:MAG: hypothetical protein AB1486_23420 [Planctomycetota bacterium]
MRIFIIAVVALAVVALAAKTQDDPSKIHLAKTDGSTESGFTISFPVGSSDLVNVRYDNGPASVVVAGLSVAVADQGASSGFPRMGAFPPNLGLDPSGNTPDLSAAYSEVFSPPVLGGPIGDHVDILMPRFVLASGATLHLVVQYPPGDPGLLAVHADTDVMIGGGDEALCCPNPFDSSGYTTDGYHTPATFPYSHGELGVNALIDPGGEPDSRLRLYFNGSDLTGDYLMGTVGPGDTIGLAVFAPSYAPAPTVWVLFLSAGGVPLAPLTGVLPTIPNLLGNGTYLRVSAPWPSGFSGWTFNFVAVTGAPGVLGSVQTSNEVTLHSQ